MLMASRRRRWNSLSPVMAVPTRVGPMEPIIFSCGHLTTETKGNMYSWFASCLSGESQWITVGLR